MNRILILGSGLVAQPIIRYLLSKGYFVTVASNTPDRSDAMIAGNEKGKSIYWEATDEGSLNDLVAGHDITVSLLPYVFHVMVARHCINHKKNLVTSSYVKPEMRALDEAARNAGIILLNEMGLDPGIDHMSAMRIIDRIHDRGGAILEFYSICGALPAPEAANNPFRYKFSWSPKGVILAGNNDATYLQRGKTINLPTEILFRNPFKLDFPGVGSLEVYPNRDSISYKEIYAIPEARTMFRGTFRYTGWCEILDALKKMKLISPEKFDMSGMTYAGLMVHQLRELRGVEYVKSATGANLADTVPIPELMEQVAGFIGVDADSVALSAMKWLGLFSTMPMNRNVDSTFEVVSDLMIEKMTLGPEERDMVVMQHLFLAGYSDGSKEVIRSRMLDFGTLSTDTSIARTVALPAAIGVEMVLNGQIRVKGVHVPVIPEIYNPVLDRLETLGIKMIEEYNLPASEMIGYKESE